MHFASTLLQLAAFGALPIELANSLTIPGQRQVHWKVDDPTRISHVRGHLDGLRFYKRKAGMHIALADKNPLFGRGDSKSLAASRPNDRDNSRIPRKKRQVGLGASVHILPGDDEGGRGRVYIGRYDSRSLYRIVNSRASGYPVQSKVRRSARAADMTPSVMSGMPGSIDIVSPTVDNPVGVKIASLSVSSELSSQNQFVLNASGNNASTIYLHVKSATDSPGNSLTVSLEVPVYDEAQATYVAYCATFETDGASPLTAYECEKNGNEVSNNRSQLFEYNPGTRIIKPLWLSGQSLAATSTNDTSTQLVPNATDAAMDTETASDIVSSFAMMATSTLPSPTTRNLDPLPLAKGGVKPNGSKAVGNQKNSQKVELIFTPKLDDGTPIVNSESSTQDIDSSAASEPTSSSMQASPTFAVSEATVTSSAAAFDGTGRVMGVDESSPDVAAPDPGLEPAQDDGSSASPSSVSAGGAETPDDEAPSPTLSQEVATPTSDLTAEPSSPGPAAPLSERDIADEGNIEDDDSMGNEDNAGEETNGGDNSDTQDGDGDGAGDDDSEVDDAPGMSSASGHELRSLDTGYGWRFNPRVDVSDLVR